MADGNPGEDALDKFLNEKPLTSHSAIPVPQPSATKRDIPRFSNYFCMHGSYCS